MQHKLTKKQIIDIINIFYLKKGIKIETNLKKLSKNKLLNLITEENIPILNETELKLEIEENEKFTINLEIIYYNFMRYKNISSSIIIDIKKNNNLTANDLQIIIDNNNLIIDDIENVRNINKMILEISNIYNLYSNKKSLLEYKTIPDIIKCLSHYLTNE